jgi:pyruvate formate lyase activating enzyme
MQKAKWFQQKENICICECCPHRCNIVDQKTGICGTYIHSHHQLWNQRYYRFSSICIDPIEKKPLYHFFPGESILSLGGYGCNLSCFYCQNHSISQNTSLGETLSPESIIAEALKHQSIGIALTYNEPCTNIETALDLFSKCHKKNLQTVMVTNGYVNPEPLIELVPHVDAVNIDLKFSNNADYRKYTGGTIDPVIEAIKIFHTYCLTEITYLVIPGINDSFSSIETVCKIVSSIDSSIPIHFTAYYPHWKSTIPATTPETIRDVCHFASQFLAFVYGGNVPYQFAPSLHNTYCPQCHSIWIERNQNQIRIQNIHNHRCANCGTSIENIKGIES